MPATPILAACVTPWTGNGSLDEPALRRQLGYLGRRGLGVCLGAYGYGEGLLLDPAEKRRLYEIGVRELGGKVPVVAVGLGYTATAQVIREAREAAQIGADAAQIYPPRTGPNAAPVAPAMLEAYLREVCEAVRTPLVLGLQAEYMPEGVFPLDLVEALLADYPHVVALHCTTREEAQQVAVARRFGARLPVRCASLDLLLANLAAGGAGYLGPEGNFAPSWLTGIVADFRRGAPEAARAGLARLLSLNTTLRKHPVRAEKMAVHLLGRIEPHARRPYLPLGEEERAEILAVLRDAGLFAVEAGEG